VPRIASGAPHLPHLADVGTGTSHEQLSSGLIANNSKLVARVVKVEGLIAAIAKARTSF